MLARLAAAAPCARGALRAARGALATPDAGLAQPPLVALRTLSTLQVPATADRFAVVELSGTQHKVTPECVLCTQLLDGEVGSTINLDRVLLLGTRHKTVIGSPHIAGATVKAVVEEHNLMDKVIVFKKKRRKNYRRWNGHRQRVTVLRIKSIESPFLDA